MNHTRESEVNRAPGDSGRGRADAGGGRARAGPPSRGAARSTGPGSRRARTSRAKRPDRPGPREPARRREGGRAGAAGGEGRPAAGPRGIAEAGRSGGKAGTGRRRRRPRGRPGLRAGTTGSGPRLSGPPRRSARRSDRGKSLRPAGRMAAPPVGGRVAPPVEDRGASPGAPRGGAPRGGAPRRARAFRRPEGRRGRSADDPLCDRGLDRPGRSGRFADETPPRAPSRPASGGPPPLFDRPFPGGGRGPGWPEVGWRRVRGNAPGRFRPGAIRAGPPALYGAGEPRSGRGNRRLNSPHR